MTPQGNAPGHRGWGKAMIAELGHVHSRRDRARLVLGAVRVALLPPPAHAGYGRAARPRLRRDRQARRA